MSVASTNGSPSLASDMQYLFDKRVIPDIAKNGLPEGIVARPLARDDHTRNHVSLLSNLSVAPDLSPSTYTERFDAMKASGDTYHTLVLHHLPSDKIIGSATLVVELKFLRNAGKIGHIEDVVVDPKFGGMKLGVRLIKSLEAMARGLGCYKTILDCSKENMGFYEKCGFTHKEYEMVCYAPPAVVEATATASL